jgi:hypothetical protein
MFQEALQFKVVIVLCYNQQTTMRITSRVPPLLTWHIFEIIIDVLFSVVNVCVLNKCLGIGYFLMP